MAPKNRRPDLNGILIVDKPLHWSSARVCAVVRRATDGAKVGHAGTLDPLATGVLVVCLGRATKAVPSIQAMGKTYDATVDLSEFSTTDDAEGEPIPPTALDPARFGVTPIVRPAARASPPSRAEVEATLNDRFVGSLIQTPPDFSAAKSAGERAYKVARRGGTVEVRSKRVEVHSVEVTAYQWPELGLRIRCGKGTYIRSLARDLGLTLGTGGRLSALRRTAVGAYSDVSAVDPNGLLGDAGPGSMSERIVVRALQPVPERG